MKAAWVYAAWNWLSPRWKKWNRVRRARGKRGTVRAEQARLRYEGASREAMRDWLWV